MRWLDTVAILCVLVGSGCGSGSQAKPAESSARTRPRAARPPASLYLEPEQTLSAQFNIRDLRFVGMDDGPVPDFRLRTEQGSSFDSRQLVGERPFVVVFFATWCAVCNLKMPMLRRALEVTEPVTVIGVAVDDPQTWPRVTPYLKRHGLTRMPLVRAQRYPAFAISYNPFSTVPLVVVVGKNGGLVDYQIGYAPNDEQRLEAALRLAKRIGPLKGHP
ncbi:MAG TPA: TlpA disulfide reductase family protein [Polyangiaceae bacterium]|nr:TlpA disulfide reductase family protein [Polyangiaceae bacterium]